MPDRNDAKKALDSIISKSRVHLYKPIQIAEILYRARVHKDINPLNLEEYRTKSKKWRDDICRELLGRACTSSARFQDDLFNGNAMPPVLLNELHKENIKTKGAVEAYVYRRFTSKYNQLAKALDYCRVATRDTFDVRHLIYSFWDEPGLRRSLDKIYEIIVYALFSTLIEVLNLKVEISVDDKHFEVLSEFEDFSRKIMNLDISHPAHSQDARVFRVGVTNAADRGLDMYSNWGPAIQIKHLCLDVSLAENIVDGVSNDKVVIVCKAAERDIIMSLLTQIGWRSRIQSIVTEDDLVLWYDKALRGKYGHLTGDSLIECLGNEIAEEFPAVKALPSVIKERHYEKTKDSFWV